jgi:uncharacterized DUF497 family protein
MRITFDAEKRAKTLDERGLDFSHAGEVFHGDTLTIEDDRWDYGEVRYQTIGRLKRSVIMMVWTPRGDARHIISMRKCNAKEREKYGAALDRS